MAGWNSIYVVCSVVLHLLHVASHLYPASAATINVQQLGADSRGISDSSGFFEKAWSTACSSPSSSPSVVYVPRGSYLLRHPVVFSGICSNTVSFRIEGTLVAPSDYRVLASYQSWISFHGVKGVSITGGVLDGRGRALWACKTTRSTACPTGATSLQISNSENVTIQGLSSLNSQMFHIVVNGCRNVKIQRVRVAASGSSPNTDGIHVQLSSDVIVLDSSISTGDDCVSIGPGTSNLWIENVRCGPGHGISIGSLGKKLNEPGVQNLTIKTVTFTNTQNGVRIKSWARPSNGFVRHVLFQHVTMVDVQNPIIIDQNYCPHSNKCPGQESGVRITDVAYEDIHGTSATKVAVKLDCSSASPCTGIRMRNVQLSYGTDSASATCTHVTGKALGLQQPDMCL